MKQVPNESGREMAKEEGYIFSGESSAKNNTNIKTSIDNFIESIYEKQIMFDVEDNIVESRQSKSKSRASLKQAPEERMRKLQKSDCVIF
mmetsp:Transcript_2976/g.3521  ORF Transcript_2976/g.3521 Transcript_2976/m.3521 type:complete len:90 (+) Transcript_2976:398-667(+)